MEERGMQRIESGTEVFDRDGHKLGTVSHVHELDAPGARGYLEVATGFLSRLGLGKHLFVPLETVRDVTEGGVFLSAGRDEADQAAWQTRPAALEQRVEPAATVATVAAGDAAVSGAQSGTDQEDWPAATPRYRRRWEEHYGQPGARWETYEARYRFAWEMARLPAFAGQSWTRVRPELRDRWEVQHPEVDWDTVEDSVRDAWENVASAAGAAVGAAPSSV